MNIEEHLMQLLQEEAAEVIQAASKVNRFNPADTYDGKNEFTARENLECEVDDLLAILQMLRNRGLLRDPSPTLQSRKRAKVHEMLKYAKERGTLTGDIGP